ncbi:hypothetical protein MKW98_002698 [Papaver atlanticum]|uniref:Uncharacterized protein n=1 Tax=Papaver atlanticum TaxID=357466 RepID=A0AAD4SB77_9MAGN|nr:hypothetical protein MKW98_002698 [Papaver atlanticum]
MPGVTKCFECLSFGCYLLKLNSLYVHKQKPLERLLTVLIKWDEVHSGKAFNAEIVVVVQVVHNHGAARNSGGGPSGTQFSQTQHENCLFLQCIYIIAFAHECK